MEEKAKEQMKAKGQGNPKGKAKPTAGKENQASGVNKPKEASKAKAEEQAKARERAKAEEQAKAREKAKAEEQAKARERAKAEEQARIQERAKAEEQAKAQERAKAEEQAKAREKAKAEEQAKAQENAEAKEKENHKNKRHREHRHSLAAPIGGLFVVLAAIGLITVITFSLRATERLLDNSKSKEEFARVILPVLMFDPVPFESPAELNDLVLLRSSIWSALIENIDKYIIDDAGRVMISKGDVDVACAHLYGPEIQLNHQSFNDYMVMYYFNERTESYLVPVEAENILYTPQVEEIRKEGDIYTLTVGYLSNSNDWFMTMKGEKYEPTPGKYMVYKLQKTDGHYQLLAIEDPPEGAVPGIPQIQPENETVISPPTIPPQQLPVTPEDEEEPEDEDNEEPTETKEPEEIV